MLDLDPARVPVPPRPAATIIVLREGAPGCEVLCVERTKKSGFLGGAVVFPGGAVDPTDRDPRWVGRVAPPSPPQLARHEAMADADTTALAAAIAASRESAEEAAIVHARPAMSHDEALALQHAAREGGLSMLHWLEARETILRLDALHPFGRWVTPEAEQRRFDARFFALVAPEGQRGAHDERETTSSFWATPRSVIARFEKGEVFLAPPTLRMLEILASLQSTSDLPALAAAQNLAPICPHFCVEEGVPTLALPGDPLHEIPERRVVGPTRFVLREGRFVGVDPT